MDCLPIPSLVVLVGVTESFVSPVCVCVSKEDSISCVVVFCYNSYYTEDPKPYSQLYAVMFVLQNV